MSNIQTHQIATKKNVCIAQFSKLSDAMHLKHEVVAKFLGVQVYVDLSVLGLSFDSTNVPEKVQGFTSDLHDKPAIMLPSEFHMLTFVIDGLESVFVRTELCPDSLFTAQGQWNVLSRIFGADSVVHCMLYRDQVGKMVLAAFDVTRLKGVDLRSQDILQRHVQVHEILHRVKPVDVQYHWLGYARSCHESISDPHKPFTSHQMLVFNPDQNLRVLARIAIP